MATDGDCLVAVTAVFQKRADEELGLLVDNGVHALLPKTKVPQRAEGKPPLFLPICPRIVEYPTHFAIGSLDVLVEVPSRPGAHAVH